MIRNGLFTIGTLVSVIFFPWPLTVFLALISSLFEPLLPFAAGIFADTLYYSPGAGAMPTYAFYGLVVSIVVISVRSQLRTGTIG